MTEPGDEITAQAIRTLKAALVQGRLTEDEYDERMSRASASHSRAELAPLTADLPVGRMDAPARPPTANDVRIGVRVIIAAASVVAAILLWHPGNALAFMAFWIAAITLLVAPIVTAGLIVDVRRQNHQLWNLPARVHRRGHSRRCPAQVAGPGDVLQDVAMTGDDLPAAARPGAGDKPELRASHEDRDRVVEVLRVAAGDGRLTEAELDERLGVALTARTSGELAALTADLPEVGRSAARAKDVVRLDYQGGNTTRRGRWMVPQRMEIRAVGGTVKLDFTDAVITSPTLQIQAEVRGGRLVLVTKPGIEVDADDVAVHGGGVKVWPEHGWDAPVSLKIEVSGQARGGHVVARPPRRTFRQWVLRRPRPYLESARD
jgi:Domain of unknown function (DUF1707)